MEKNQENEALKNEAKDEIQRLERELRVMTKRLEIALRHMNGDLWEYNVTDKSMKRLTVSDSQIVLSELPDLHGRLKAGNSEVHKESANDALAMALELEAGAELSERELRFRDKDGTPQWYKVSFRSVYGEKGEPYIAIGFAENITDRKAKELRAFKERKYLESIVSEALCAYEINLTRQTVESPKRHTSGDDVCLNLLSSGENWVVSPYDRDILVMKLSSPALIKAFEEGRRQVRAEYRCLKNGQAYWVSAAANLAQANQSSDLYAFIYVKNIDKRKEVERELKKKASLDSLTGLYNRQAGTEKISEALLTRTNNSVSALLMLDIDNFKALNDTQGHSVGDSFLKDVANAIRALIRKDDILCRVGGDEFFIYMSNVNETLITNRAQKLREAVKETAARYKSEEISLSIGAAMVNDFSSKFKDVYERADAALYEAKRKGKDSFEIYH